MAKKKQFPIIPSNRIDDIHHLKYLEAADLILYVAGNQFMVMEKLLTLFQQLNPEVKYIFYETLPPGLELKQILSGGAIFKERCFLVYQMFILLLMRKLCID